MATLPRISPSQAQWAAARWPDMDMKKLEETRTLYATRCSGCHNLVVPEKHSMSEWDVLLSSMAPRAKISVEQKESIRRYLFTVKSVPAAPPVK